MVTKPNKPTVGAPNGNTNALKYKSEKELELAIDSYFDDCKRRNAPYTMTGLALALGLDRRTLVNYGNNELYFPLIKKAKETVEESLEEKLVNGTGSAPGIIFNLKNNYGWVDRQDISANVDTTVDIEVKFDE